MAFETKSYENTWTKTETEFLISVYEKYPILYNSKHEDFLKTYKKESAMDKIAAEVEVVKPGVSAKSIRRKIKTLRTQMTMEQKNIVKNICTGIDEDYVPKLWCYNHLTFLLHSNDDCDASSNMKDPLEPESSGGSDDNDFSRRKNKESIAVTGSLKRQKRVPSKIDLMFEDAGKSLELVRCIAENSFQPKKPFSNQMLFCNYICSELEELETTFDDVKQEIMNLVMNAKLREKAIKENRSSHQNS